MKKPKPRELARDGSTQAFKQLRSLLEGAGLTLEKPTVQETQPPAPSRVTCREPASDDEIFLQALEGVQRATWPRSALPSPAPEPKALKSTEAEERRLMEAAVNGDPLLEVPDHPEYIEGWIGTSGRRFMPGLRNGLYSIQEQIDLHGLGRDDARDAVETFIERAARYRACCVKIIHGRGINSPSEKPVLKECVQRWLSTRRMSRHVVAFASAPLKDGGVGALYVLLKTSDNP